MNVNTVRIESVNKSLYQASSFTRNKLMKARIYLIKICLFTVYGRDIKNLTNETKIL